jgi:cation diffusion facilitator CzcD-associated flavoprotein CzcO
MNGQYDAIIIGAGFGGISAAKELMGAGITNFLVLEQGGDVAGIWRDNIYPGIRCDIPADLYSYESDPPKEVVRHPEGDFHRRYLRQIADKYDLWPRIQLNMAASRLDYDESQAEWTVTTKNGDTYCTRFLIPAVGMLHIPFTPVFVGSDAYKGITIHTARWDPALDIVGKNIAIIGTGPSAVQVIPEIAAIAKSLYVFQRTPGWVVPLKRRNDFGALTTLLFARYPWLRRVYRNAVLYGSSFVLSPLTSRGWSTKPLELWANIYRRQQVRHSVLREKLTPNYPLGCKRILVESQYYRALQSPNVELVTDPIDHLTATGIATRDGRECAVDVIIYATGFDTTDFLQSLEVRGKDGILIGEQWAANRTSYLGLATPNFPNMFTVHAHGSFTASGSNIFMAEAQSAAAVRAIQWAMSQPKPCAVEVKSEAMDAYERFLAKKLSTSVLGNCTSWFQDKTGQVVNIWPHSPLAFRKATRRAPHEVFELTEV